MRRAAWKHMVDGSKEEALIGIDMYNRPLTHGSFHGFVVHMHLAWLYVLHAEFSRDGVDYRYRQANGRFVRVDGEPKTWELARCVEERWLADNPVRKNLELFIGLRNKIEHRYQKALSLATAGEVHASVINYENELVVQFGAANSLADQLRFPLFISSLTGEGAALVRTAMAKLPKRASEFLTSYRSALDPSILEDQRYEYRLRLVPALGAKTDADMAIDFVRLDELSHEERELMVKLGKAGKVLVREQRRPVANLDLMKPRAAERKIEEALAYRFTSADFLIARSHFGVRPESQAKHPDRTDERYCIYDQPHKDYLYTEAFVKKVIREVDSPEKYRAFIGKEPRMKS